MKLNKTYWTNFPNFKPSEFKCGCGCESEHVEMDINLLFVLQSIRKKFGVPVNITSGHRCLTFNDSLPNSAKGTSDHIDSKAADFYMSGGQTSTLEGRKEVMRYIMQFPCVSYCYCNGAKLDRKGKWYVVNSPKMATSIHISVD